MQSLDVQGALLVGGRQNIIADADVTNKICKNGGHQNTRGWKRGKAAREDSTPSTVNDLIVATKS